MPTVPAVHRLSPRVRRLLVEHELVARSLPGTGADGRVTARDVLRAAGAPGATRGDGVLASPLARRLLRDAGVDPEDAARANEADRLTGGDVERLVASVRSDGTSPDRRRGARSRDGSSPHDGATEDAASRVVERTVDVAAALAALTAAQPSFVARHGFELGLEVLVAHAAAAVLATRPELPGGAVVDGVDTDRSGIHVGVLAEGADGTDVVAVRDAQDLTVAGLARRARRDVAGPDGGEATAAPTVVVAGEGTSPDVGLEVAVGVVTCGGPVLQQLRGVDHLGHDVIHTRPRATLGLHPGEDVPPGAAGAFMDALEEALVAWTLQVGQ